MKNGSEKLPMRVALGMFAVPERERLIFGRQFGVDDILVFGTTLRRPLSEHPSQWELEITTEEFRRLREAVEREGVRLFGIENLPFHFYDKIMFGKAGREEQLAHYQNMIRNMAEAGIYNLGYNWVPSGVKRTDFDHMVRGGAHATGYEHDRMDQTLILDRVYTEEEMWENHGYFIRGIMPVAEECGVTVSVHPNDPPVEAIGGIPHLFRSPEAYWKAFGQCPSHRFKATFCLGNFEEMGCDLFQAIREFGEKDKIHVVHFQSVRGSVPAFYEEFIDTGDYDPFDIIQALDEAGYSGIIIPGHTPQTIGDVEWRTEESNRYTAYHHPMGGYRGRAYTVGYINALLLAQRHVKGMDRAADEDRRFRRR